MKVFSTADLNKQVGAVTDAALREPVFITHHKRPRFVLMTIDAYERMAAKSEDGRRAYATSELPDDIREGLLALVDGDRSGDERP